MVKIINNKPKYLILTSDSLGCRSLSALFSLKNRITPIIRSYIRCPFMFVRLYPTILTDASQCWSETSKPEC